MAKQNKKSSSEKTGDIATQATRAHPLTPFEEMDRLMESFMPRRWLHPFRWDMPSLAELGAPFEMKLPKVDVIDRDHEIIVKAELPGVVREDIDVSVSDNSVTIKGETSHEEKEERGSYFRSEISRGSFSRTVALPAMVDSESASASFRDGILELTLPKAEGAKRKSVKIEE